MSIRTIKNKRILFFCPSFFNYENEIAEKMREMGAQVDSYDVRSISSPLSKALLKLSPNLFLGHSKKYYDAILKNNLSKDYDYILIIKCDMTPLSVLKQLRVLYPRAKLCLYLWDSIDNIPGIKKKLACFDIIHSFDLTDCANYPKLNFRALFFSDQYRVQNNSSKEKYDICFLGTIHSDRYSIIKNVQAMASSMGLTCYWFLYLQSKFIYYFYKFVNNTFRKSELSEFSFSKMTASEISAIIDETRVILDIQHPNQSGLTMRTIEAIGKGKKLITTNASIKKYDFYNPNNIAVVDRNNIKIDVGFFKNEYIPLDKSVREKYSIDSWILDVLSQ